jgi:hypothetical protein
MVNFEHNMETTTIKSNQIFEVVMETNFDILHNGPTYKNKWAVIYKDYKIGISQNEKY